MPTFIALLRGINVSGRNKIAMAALRQLGEELGFGGVRTYIQSGNVVLATAGGAAVLERKLEAAIAERFGFSVPVIARTARQWSAYLEGNPFRAAAELDANHVLLGLSKARPAQGALAALRARAAAGELVELVGDALWIHFAGGVARSKLTPAVIDRAAGSSVTARNWRTVQALAEMTAAAAVDAATPPD